MRPKVICHMMSPLDGRVVVEDWSAGPDADYDERVAIYYELHAEFGAKAWIAGRVSMEPFRTGQPRAPRTNN